MDRLGAMETCLRGGDRLVFRRGRIRVNAAEGLREAVLAHQGLTMASE